MRSCILGFVFSFRTHVLLAPKVFQPVRAVLAVLAFAFAFAVLAFALFALAFAKCTDVHLVVCDESFCFVVHAFA